MPAEIYDKMFVEAGLPLDEAAFTHGLTMSRTGRVRAKKQHLRMATYLQSQMDGENDENSNHEKNETTALFQTNTLPHPGKHGKSPRISAKKIKAFDTGPSPDEILCTNSGQINEGRNLQRTEESKQQQETEKTSSQNGFNRPKSTFERSNSHEELAHSTRFDRTQQNFKAMTLSRVPRNRIKSERPPVASPVRKDKCSKFIETASPRKDRSDLSKFYLDLNGNDASRKGNTLGRYRGKEASFGSEDELFIPRSSTFSTYNKPTKPFRKTRKSEADDFFKSVEITLEDMLKNKPAMQAFREFLKSEFSEENLDFWLDCEQYKSMKGSKQLKMAFKIFARYLARSAPREVNIESEIRSRLEENLKNPDKNSFVEAQNCIYSLMKSDPFRRFTTSERFIKLQLTDPKLALKLTSARKVH